MKSRPQVGTVGELAFVVETAHAIDFADAQMPAVLCTPWLLWFLEHAAREAMLPHLDDGESTVGVQFDLRHLAATPVGGHVTCRARLLSSDRSLFVFQLEARDEQERIALGTHQLRVIRAARLAERVRAKAKERS